MPKVAPFQYAHLLDEHEQAELNHALATQARARAEAQEAGEIIRTLKARARKRATTEQTQGAGVPPAEGSGEG